MRRTVLPLAFLFAVVATPASAIDLGRLLPMPEVPLPDWLSTDAPAPTPVEPAAPRSDAAAARPIDKPGQDASAATGPDPAPQAAKPAARTRGWRSLLPGSIK